MLGGQVDTERGLWGTSLSLNWTCNKNCFNFNQSSAVQNTSNNEVHPSSVFKSGNIPKSIISHKPIVKE